MVSVVVAGDDEVDLFVVGLKSDNVSLGQGSRTSCTSAYSVCVHGRPSALRAPDSRLTTVVFLEAYVP